MKEKEIQVLKEERHCLGFFSLFFFFSHKRPWTQGSPEDTLPRRTPNELRTTTVNRFTKQQIYTQHHGLASKPMRVEGYQPLSSRRLNKSRYSRVPSQLNDPPIHIFALFLP